MSAGTRTALMALLAVIFVFGIHATPGQNEPVQPRTPMGPGSEWGNKVWLGQLPLDRMNTMAPPHLGGLSPPNQTAPQWPNLAGQEADAINVLKEKKADVVVLSKANAVLIVQLYRPDQNQWQEYRLAPLTMTSITCESCSGRLRFAFNDGVKQLEMDVEAPSVLRVFPDASTKQWRWDSFKLVVSSTPEGPQQ
jgi:hypothetical protein